MAHDDKFFSTIRMMRDFRTLDDELIKIIGRPQFPKETNTAAREVKENAASLSK